MKQINIQNIKIREMMLSIDNNDCVISVGYRLIDEDGKEWGGNRTTLKDFTKAERNKITNVFSMVENKLKEIEEI